MSRLISYYGDDFTGSTDVMEALASHGVNTVLFTRVPSAAEFAPFTEYMAFGLAGTSRSRTPEWMDEHLPRAFAWLKQLGAHFCHYKVCSTFDSGPATGNIGRATEIGARVFEQACVPLVVGAPQLKRYTFAGNLFAGYQGLTYRIDRHPVMSRHPVTPMDEADLRLHLKRQTDWPVALANVDWPPQGIGLVDVHDAATQLAAGQRLLGLPRHAGPFVVGSSGIEYALVKALAASGAITGLGQFAPLAAVPRVMAVSGSVSPTTERQIRHALAHGFEGLAADPLLLAQSSREGVARQLADRAAALLNQGRSVLVYTALGPASDMGHSLAALPEARQRIGESLGQVLALAIARTGLRRVILSGGDSSSHGLGQLDIHALTTRFPLAATPGSPLCTGHSTRADLDGLEIALKGGQVGGDGYFVSLRDGIP